MKFSQFRTHTPPDSANAYVFICEDDYLVDESRAVWERIFGGAWEFEKLSAKEFEAIDAARLMESALTPPLFGPRRVLLVRGAGKLTKKGRQVVEEIADLEDAHLKIILVAPTRRSVTSLTKDGGLGVVEIEPFRTGDTVRWLSQRPGVTQDVARHLVEHFGTDLGALHHEIEKLDVYLGGERGIEIADIERLTFRTERFGPFELEDSVLEQDYPKSVLVSGAMMEEGLEPVVWLFRLARVWRQILVGKALAGSASPSEIGRAASVPDWKASRFAAAADRFDWERVVGGFGVLAATDKALKTTSPNVPVTADVVLWKLIG
jgi:DNA polymerase-3 subunit delta